MNTQEHTPFQQQYLSTRKSLSADAVLFFKMGDFYEVFFDDARPVALLLNIAHTKRNGVPMCGVPYHMLDKSIQILIQAGKQVAICEEVGKQPTIATKL